MIRKKNKNEISTVPNDAHIWVLGELPLDDITNTGDKDLTTSTKGKSCTSNTLNKQSVISTTELCEPYNSDSIRKRQRLDNGHHLTNLTEKIGTKIKPVNSNWQAAPSAVLVPDTQTLRVSESQNGPGRPANVQTPCTDTAKFHQTPKRYKRKFPGPAGLLPKLQGLKQSPDLSEIVKCPSAHQEPQNDSVLASSQSEDSFNELPWQTLIKDLGNDRQKYLKEFSIANSLQKSKKKLLPRGKVPFVMGIIETVDWQGSEASVVLKDKTGYPYHKFWLEDIVKEK
ncbi:hypothetical protein KUTeg_020766 [Tegillarca granosa]|uniref:Uncharacterized protein n=1 Tax=Tegillarca granosa TaxID=220873 RepID=A0ABQ9E8X4_TEGGR|nr:hypothetical protein KUTeg_020766 [Tegillarca granosa]